jgi:hypothetical protein
MTDRTNPTTPPDLPTPTNNFSADALGPMLPPPPPGQAPWALPANDPNRGAAWDQWAQYQNSFAGYSPLAPFFVQGRIPSWQYQLTDDQGNPVGDLISSYTLRTATPVGQWNPNRFRYDWSQPTPEKVQEWISDPEIDSEWKRAVQNGGEVLPGGFVAAPNPIDNPDGMTPEQAIKLGQSYGGFGAPDPKDFEPYKFELIGPDGRTVTREEYEKQWRPKFTQYRWWQPDPPDPSATKRLSNWWDTATSDPWQAAKDAGMAAWDALTSVYSSGQKSGYGQSGDVMYNIATGQDNTTGESIWSASPIYNAERFVGNAIDNIFKGLPISSLLDVTGKVDFSDNRTKFASDPANKQDIADAYVNGIQFVVNPTTSEITIYIINAENPALLESDIIYGGQAVEALYADKADRTMFEGILFGTAEDPYAYLPLVGWGGRTVKAANAAKLARTGQLSRTARIAGFVADAAITAERVQDLPFTIAGKVIKPVVRPLGNAVDKFNTRFKPQATGIAENADSIDVAGIYDDPIRRAEAQRIAENPPPPPEAEVPRPGNMPDDVPPPPGRAAADDPGFRADDPPIARDPNPDIEEIVPPSATPPPATNEAADRVRDMLRNGFTTRETVEGGALVVEGGRGIAVSWTDAAVASPQWNQIAAELEQPLMALRKVLTKGQVGTISQKVERLIAYGRFAAAYQKILAKYGINVQGGRATFWRQLRSDMPRYRAGELVEDISTESLVEDIIFRGRNDPGRRRAIEILKAKGEYRTTPFRINSRETYKNAIKDGTMKMRGTTRTIDGLIFSTHTKSIPESISTQVTDDFANNVLFGGDSPLMPDLFDAVTVPSGQRVSTRIGRYITNENINALAASRTGIPLRNGTTLRGEAVYDFFLNALQKDQQDAYRFAQRIRRVTSQFVDTADEVSPAGAAPEPPAGAAPEPPAGAVPEEPIVTPPPGAAPEPPPAAGATPPSQGQPGAENLGVDYDLITPPNNNWYSTMMMQSAQDAINMGFADEIAEMSARGFTAAEIADYLNRRMPMTVDVVTQARAGLGIKSTPGTVGMGATADPADLAAWAQWQSDYWARRGLTVDTAPIRQSLDDVPMQPRTTGAATPPPPPPPGAEVPPPPGATPPPPGETVPPQTPPAPPTPPQTENVRRIRADLRYAVEQGDIPESALADLERPVNLEKVLASKVFRGRKIVNGVEIDLASVGEQLALDGTERTLYDVYAHLVDITGSKAEARRLTLEAINYSNIRNYGVREVGKLMKVHDLIYKSFLGSARRKMQFNVITGPKVAAIDLMSNMAVIGAEEGASLGLFADGYKQMIRAMREGDLHDIPSAHRAIWEAYGVEAPSFGDDIGTKLSIESTMSNEGRKYWFGDKWLGQSRGYRAAAGAFESEWLKAVRRANDLGSRDALQTAVFMREVNKGRIAFLDELRQAAERKGLNGPDIVRQFEQTLDGAFSPQAAYDEVMRLVDDAGVATQMKRRWTNVVAQSRSEARRVLWKRLFPNRATALDVAASKVFLFHYWTSRAIPMFAEAALTNWWQLNLYLRAWDAAADEAEKNGYPRSLKGFTSFMNSREGFTAYINPLTLLTAVGAFAEMAEEEDPNRPRGGWGDFLNAMNSVFFINPIIQGALITVGLSSIDGEQMVSGTPNIFGIRPITNAAKALTQWASANNDNAMLDKLEQIFGGNPEEWFVRTVLDQANRAAQTTNLVGDWDAYDPNRGDVAKMQAELVARYEQKFGATADAWSVQQQDEYNAAFHLLLTGASGNDIVNSVRRDYWGAKLGAIPFGAWVRSDARDEMTAEFQRYDKANRTPTQAMFDRREVMNAGSAEQLQFATLQEQYKALGTDRQRALAEGFKMITDAEFDGQFIWVLGRPYTKDALLAMPEQERMSLAYTWLGEQGGQQDYEAYKNLSEQFRKDHPQIQQYNDYISTMDQFETTAEWRSYLAQSNNAFAAAQDAQRRRFERQNLSPEAIEEKLDVWARGPEGFMNFLGNMTYVYNNPLPEGNTALPRPAEDVQPEGPPRASDTESPFTSQLDYIQAAEYNFKDQISNAEQRMKAQFPEVPIPNWYAMTPQERMYYRSLLGDDFPEPPVLLINYWTWAAREKAAGRSYSKEAFAEWLIREGGATMAPAA